jgi:type I restriction enzyme S subunit
MKSNGWTRRRLDELGFVGRGKSRHRPRNEPSLYGGPYPFIQTAEIMAAAPYITTYSQTYSELGLRQSKMWPANTLCMTIAGANTAKVAILKIEACFPDSVVGFIPDESKADLHFVLYSLELMKDQFLAVSRGATQDNLGLSKLLSFPLLVPEVQQQRRIAAILTAYDGLIENNKRRIELLEKLAEEIYREWFVRLRFPGHQKVKRVRGISTGWERTKVATLVSYLKRGVAPKYDDFATSIAINQKCIRDGRIDLSFARHQSREVSTIRQIKFGDVLVNSTGEGTLGRVAQVLTPVMNCIADSHVTIVRPKPEVPIHYFGMTLKAWEPHFSTMGRGSTNQTELSPSAIGGIEVTMPSKQVQEAFELHAKPLFSQIAQLTAQNECLVRTRDFLAPRLISGRLSVENLNIQFTPAIVKELKTEPGATAHA